MEDRIMSFSGLKETKRKLLKLYDFISKYKTITDSHSVDFFTQELWVKLIPKEWKVDLLSLSGDQFLYPDRLLSTGPLKDFLCTIQDLRLFPVQLHDCQKSFRYDLNYIDCFSMSQKKAHEVHMMSECIKSLALPLEITQVVDVGSGKGYLSEYLSFYHQFDVIGIESQSITTTSAIERCRKVEKYCKDHRKGKHMYIESDFSILYPSDNTVFKEPLNLILEPSTEYPVEPATVHTFEQTDICNTELTTVFFNESNGRVRPIITDSPIEIANVPTVEQLITDYSIEPITDRSRTDSPIGSITECTLGTTNMVVSTTDCTVKSTTNFVGLNTDCTVELASVEFNSQCKVNNSKSQFNNAVSLTQSFTPVTHCLNWNDDIIEIAGDHFDSDHCAALVGLHTCGDLACFIIRQFVQQNAFQVLCVIGCCYHHITEKESAITLVGFPMSDCLKEQGAVLGRNTRMLACQNETRLSNITSCKTVFYRAILQVILQKEMKLIKSEKDARELRVGRIKKYKGFNDYIRKALVKLGVPVELHPSDQVIDEYYYYYEPHLKRLKLYLQLKAVIAPLIESLIILDRLMFLLEHKETCNIKNAWLSQLFNPSISPRCVAICAVKEINNSHSLK